METKKLNDSISEGGSMFESGDKPAVKRKSVSKKTSLQREKEEKSEKRRELSQQMMESLSENKRLIREGGELDAGDISGMKLEHRKFGPGEVVSSDGRFFVVRFAEKEIKMQFPDAFDKGILKLPDGEDGERVSGICSRYRELDEQAAESDQKAREIGLKIAELGM